MKQLLFCINCGKAIYAAPWEIRAGKKYCSVGCSNKFRTGLKIGKSSKVKRICKYCGVEFLDWPYDKKRKYCSRECKTSYRIGKTYEDLYGDRATSIRQAQRDAKKNPYFSPEHKENISKSKKEWWSVPENKAGMTGENNPNWIGRNDYEKKRLRNRVEMKEWRESVFENDDYTCRLCGSRGGKLNAHHMVLVSDDESFALDLDYGITLCEKCHKDCHRVGGKDKYPEMFGVRQWVN